MQIEKNIPIPTLEPTRPKKQKGHSKYPFKDMEIGDSFFIAVPREKKKTRMSAILVLAKRKHPDKVFTVRQTLKGIRCWRIK